MGNTPAVVTAKRAREFLNGIDEPCSKWMRLQLPLQDTADVDVGQLKDRGLDTEHCTREAVEGLQPKWVDWNRPLPPRSSLGKVPRAVWKEVLDYMPPDNERTEAHSIVSNGTDPPNIINFRFPVHQWNAESGIVVENVVLELDEPEGATFDACETFLTQKPWKGHVTLRGGSPAVWSALLSPAGPLADNKRDMTGLILERFATFPAELWGLLAGLLNSKPDIKVLELRDIRDPDPPFDAGGVGAFLRALNARSRDRFAMVGGGMGSPYHTCATCFVALFAKTLAQDEQLRERPRVRWWHLASEAATTTWKHTPCPDRWWTWNWISIPPGHTRGASVGLPSGICLRCHAIHSSGRRSFTQDLDVCGGTGAAGCYGYISVWAPSMTKHGPIPSNGPGYQTTACS